MKWDLLKKFGLAGVFILQGVITNAETVTLLNSDPMGQSSFDSGLNWSDSTAPSLGNDYVVTGDKGFQFRTPISSENLTFGGNSLTMNGGTLFLKGNKEVTYTFNGRGLVLNRGTIQNASGGFSCVIAGNLSVGPKGGIFQFNNGGLEVTGTVTLNGPLWTENGTMVTSKFNGPVNFGREGKLGTIPAVTFVQAMASVFTFEIGGGGTTYIKGQGGGLFKGSFVFKLKPEDLVTGRSWKIVDTERKTFTETFSVTDFKKVSDIWTSNDGNYQFSESTGILSVVDKLHPGNIGTSAAVEKPDIGKAKVSPVAADSSKSPASAVARQPKETSNWIFWVVCGVGLLVIAGLVVLVIMLLRTFKG